MPGKGASFVTGTIRVKPLVVCLAVPQVGGIVSSLLAGDIRAVYHSLTLPAFAPPDWVFGVAWPVLYLLLGLACYAVWEARRAGPARVQALTFYGVQLALNFLWTPVFFRLLRLRLAFWLLCALLVLAVVTAACFYFVKKRTLWLLAPYLVWLGYAAALNGAIARLN